MAPWNRQLLHAEIVDDQNKDHGDAIFGRHRRHDGMLWDVSFLNRHLFYPCMIVAS